MEHVKSFTYIGRVGSVYTVNTERCIISVYNYYRQGLTKRKMDLSLDKIKKETL
jgi:hypothetical protein